VLYRQSSWFFLLKQEDESKLSAESRACGVGTCHPIASASSVRRVVQGRDALPESPSSTHILRFGMNPLRFLTCAAALLLPIALAAEPMNDDPYLWLEDVTGARALDWARARNAERGGA
jgi:hypothetical protein